MRAQTARLTTSKRFAAALGLGLAAFEPDARAEPVTRAEPAEVKPAAPLQRVRLAMSRAADKRLAELRVRRLLAVELGRRLDVDPDAVGPLADDLVWLWIDLTDDQTALIQVRRTGRALARRTLTLGGYSGDLAARLVALAASEMIRVQVGAPPPDMCAGCRPTGGEERGGEWRAFSVASAGLVRWLPRSAAAVIGGAQLDIGHHHGPVGQSLHFAWLVGPGESRVRWLEGGIAVDGRIGLARDWRLRLGLRGAFAAVALAGAPAHEWAVTAAGRVAIEATPARGVWLGLAAEPGAIVRPIDERVRGFTLGAAFTIAAEPTR